MKFHLVALPHTEVTRAYSNCAFTQLARTFADMMSARGHEVILYAGEQTDANVAELVTCVSEVERATIAGVIGPENISEFKYAQEGPLWTLFRNRTRKALEARLGDDDVILYADGWDLKPLIDRFAGDHTSVEYAVGYTGISHTESVGCVYPSYAWLHCVYGRWHGSVGTPGRFQDRVIPHYLDLDEHPYQETKDDYLLFVGRLNVDKGPLLAQKAADEAGMKLVVAGAGPNVPAGCDYRGLVGVEERSELMRNAAAVLVPSLYLEPFGMVAIEALAAGTPILTTDWGGLSEINQGDVGFRCHSPADFAKAARAVSTIDPAVCRSRAEIVYSTDAIAPQYEAYFEELLAN